MNMEIKFTKLTNNENIVDRALLCDIILVCHPRYNLLFIQAREKHWSAFYDKHDGTFGLSVTPTHKELIQEFKKWIKEGATIYVSNDNLTDTKFPQIKIPKQSLNAHKTPARKTTRKTVRRA